MIKQQEEIRIANQRAEQQERLRVEQNTKEFEAQMQLHQLSESLITNPRTTDHVTHNLQVMQNVSNIASQFPNSTGITGIVTEATNIIRMCEVANGSFLLNNQRVQKNTEEKTKQTQMQENFIGAPIKQINQNNRAPETKSTTSTAKVGQVIKGKQVVLPAAPPPPITNKTNNRNQTQAINAAASRAKKQNANRQEIQKKLDEANKEQMEAEKKLQHINEPAEIPRLDKTAIVQDIFDTAEPSPRTPRRSDNDYANQLADQLADPNRPRKGIQRSYQEMSEMNRDSTHNLTQIEKPTTALRSRKRAKSVRKSKTQLRIYQEALDKVLSKPITKSRKKK